VEDETRHHALFRRIAASHSERLNWVADAHALPIDVEPPRHIVSESVETVRALEDEERRGAQLLRDLARRERTRETALPCPLLNTMAMDSDKHARLLAFVAEHLVRRHPTR